MNIEQAGTRLPRILNRRHFSAENNLTILGIL